MAPTEILALQHFSGIQKYLKDTKVSLSLLTASSPDRKKEEAAIASGERHIIIGTHALVAGKVRFHDLGLSVIDEQHRFGVKQRSRLSEMGEAVNRLIMTATPIPRTLAMTLYGDLDVSTLDEKPPGRGKIVTRLFSSGGRAEALSIIRDEVEKGRQAFIIYPLIEESEKIELRAVKKMHEVLSNDELAGLKIGMVHGKMKGHEKEKIMADFSDGNLDVLIATTVIEVGIDQPNATVMMIEHAERFGLSQLHQLRGRVGRAGHDGFALLVAGEKTGNIARERLKMMERFDDGFKLANADMSIRGSGDFFGSKQSGLPGFKIADLVRDFKILAKARQEAANIAKIDPELVLKEHTALRSAIIGETMIDFSLGDVG